VARDDRIQLRRAQIGPSGLDGRDGRRVQARYAGELRRAREVRVQQAEIGADLRMAGLR
jgi:hypothetical protein